METYTLKVAPTYTTATYTRGAHFATLEEWCGRTAEEFNAGMRAKGGFAYHCERYTLSAGEFTEHVWTRARS